MPATEAQVRANRENAQKSTGPKTEAGKARARMNALKHGMRSKDGLVLPQEDPAELEARIELWIADWGPQNAIERELVERAARASWALERAERCEAALLSRRVLGARARRTAEVVSRTSATRRRRSRRWRARARACAGCSGDGGSSAGCSSPGTRGLIWIKIR